MKNRPIVAVVGRPNVGKSTLVNRMVGRRDAVVAEESGVTRDRKDFECDWTGHHFTLIDTGGWEVASPGTLASKVSVQAETAMAAADLIVFVVDASVGVTEEDGAVAALLRRGDGPVVLVAANKVDGESREADAAQFYSLGLGEVFAVSALHGRGSGELMDAMVENLGEPDDSPSESDGVPRVAIVGRPNAGKSTLFNRLVGEERSIVHDQPGTTRDAIDTVITLDSGETYCFVDTAGLRRKSRVDEAVEYYGNLRAFDAIDKSDVALLVIDASSGVSHQDQRLVERAVGGGCGIVVVLTKWDLVDDEAKEAAEESVTDRLRFIPYAPMVRVSGKTGRGLHRILSQVDRVLEAYNSRVPTHALNEALSRAAERHPAPAGRRGDRPRVLYATQAATKPPTFVLFSTRRFDQSYLNYLERSIRERLGIGPTPMKVRVRSRPIRGRPGTSRKTGGARG